MASQLETMEALNDTAITLAKKAADASHHGVAVQFAYAPATLALAAQGQTPGSFSLGS
jgi:hypothetical protein